MKQIYIIKPEREMETIMLLGEITEPYFTQEGDLGFAESADKVKELKDNLIKLHNIQELKNKISTDIDNKGISILNYCTVTRDYLKKNTNYIIKNNKKELLITI